MRQPELIGIDFPLGEPRPKGAILDGQISVSHTPERTSLHGIASIARTTTLSPYFYDRLSPDVRAPRHATASEIANDLRNLSGESPLLAMFERGVIDNNLGRLAVKAVTAELSLPKLSSKTLELLRWLESVTLADSVAVNQIADTLPQQEIEVALKVRAALEQSGSIASTALETFADLPEAQRYARLQRILDATDSAMMRAHCRHAVVINPSYLLDSAYSHLQKIPFTDRAHSQRFAAHAMAGFYWTGSDHTFLYRNRGEVAKAAARALDDYGVTRAGNFLFHDLVLIENRKGEDEFPIELVLKYAIIHYLHGGLYVSAQPDQLSPDEHVGTLTYTYRDGQRIGIELIRPDFPAAIPFRALRKTDQSDKFFEYGTDTYLAELVDVAGMTDRIDSQQGKNPDYDPILQLGQHVSALPAAVYLHSGRLDLAETTWRIILESRGMNEPDASTVAKLMLKIEDRMRGATPRDLQAIINKYPRSHELWHPLTTSYEWFQRYAREVPPKELEARGCYNPFVSPLTYKPKRKN